MTEENEITEEQRRAVREKYGNPEPVRLTQNASLAALGWLSAAGFMITIIAMIVIGSSTDPGPVTMLFWPAMLTVGPTVGFFSLVAYLAVKAILTRR